MIGEGNIFNTLGFVPTTVETTAQPQQTILRSTSTSEANDNVVQQPLSFSISLTPSNIITIVVIIAFAILLFRIYALEKEIKYLLIIQHQALTGTTTHV